MNYVYPAFIKNTDNIFRVIIPDLPKIRTYGFSLYEAINAGREACLLWLLDAEENGEEIPAPNFNRNLDTIEEEYKGQNAVRTLIDINTNEYKKEFTHDLLLHPSKKGVKLVVPNNQEEIDKYTAEKILQDSEE